VILAVNGEPGDGSDRPRFVWERLRPAGVVFKPRHLHVLLGQNDDIVVAHHPDREERYDPPEPQQGFAFDS
jgi:hypothetical protein